MNEGKKFEEDFKKSMDKYNIWNYRLTDLREVLEQCIPV